MSASGAGRYACSTQAQLADGSSEPLPSPLETAKEVLVEVPWLFRDDVKAILAKLDQEGMTICWKAPGDG